MSRIKTRDEVIDGLVDNMEDSILQDAKEGDTSVLDSILRYGGLLGYNNMTNEDLVKEYNETFDADITID